MSKVVRVWASAKSGRASPSTAIPTAAAASNLLIGIGNPSGTKYSSLAGKRADFRLSLCVVEVAELGPCAARDLRHLVAGLEAREIRTVPPGKRTAQLHPGLDRGVVDDVDRALIVRRARREAG